MALQNDDVFNSVKLLLFLGALINALLLSPLKIYNVDHYLILKFHQSHFNHF